MALKSLTDVDLKSLIEILWITGMGLQGVLAFVLLRKNGWKYFPVFTSYSLCSFMTGVSVYLVQQSRMLFFYGYLDRGSDHDSSGFRRGL
jgi:hypothetical protein